MSPRPLTNDERVELERLHRLGSDRGRRQLETQALACHAQGVPKTAIGRVLGMSESVAHRWFTSLRQTIQ